MTAINMERRLDRSTNQREALNKLLYSACAKGGFDQTFIVDDEGDLVALFPDTSDATALAPMAWLLKKAAGTLSGPASFKNAEAIIIQVPQGQSMACHFFEGRFQGAIMATAQGKMPPSTEQVLATTVDSFVRIMTKR